MRSRHRNRSLAGHRPAKPEALRPAPGARPRDLALSLTVSLRNSEKPPPGLHPLAAVLGAIGEVLDREMHRGGASPLEWTPRRRQPRDDDGDEHENH